VEADNELGEAWPSLANSCVVLVVVIVALGGPSTVTVGVGKALANKPTDC